MTHGLNSSQYPEQNGILKDDKGVTAKILHHDHENHYHEPSLTTAYCEPINSIPLSLISGIISISIITGNLLVIMAILKGPSKFRRPMYWLIIHLSIADLLVGLMLLWNYTLASLLDIHNTMTSLLVLFGIWILSVCASLFGFLLLAADRYVQIFYKNFHRTYATKCTVGTAIFFSWLIPICMFFIPPIAFDWNCIGSCECKNDSYMTCTPLTDCSQVLPPFKKVYTLYIGIYLCVLMPWPIIIYCLIYIKVRRKAQAIRHSSKRQDIRLIKTLSVIMLVFIITLAPGGILLFIDYTVVYSSKILIDLSFYIFVLGFLNSLANPLLYMWRIPAIRVSIQKFCPCATKISRQIQSSRHKPSSGEFGEASPSLPMRTFPIPDPIVKKNKLNKDLILTKNGSTRSFAAIICLRQIKRGRYTSSQTSTPISLRSMNFNHISTPNLQKDENENISVPLRNSYSEGEGEITEL